ncbi:aminotransferase class I/II-fold pyridoxal phosphate-dependent enzyme, partial [Rhizobium sp. BR5]
LSLLTDGSYRKHVEALRQRLAATVPEVAARLKAIGCVPWIEPQAGMFLWCRLPEGVDAADVARRALSQQVVLAPGNVFSSSQNASGFMRFNVSQMAGPQVMTVLTDAL